MEYVNPEMVTQSEICDLQFTLHAELVNTIRYKSEPYDTARGQVRQFNIYLPREIFWSCPIPDRMRMRIMVDL